MRSSVLHVPWRERSISPARSASSSRWTFPDGVLAGGALAPGSGADRGHHRAPGDDVEVVPLTGLIGAGLRAPARRVALAVHDPSEAVAWVAALFGPEADPPPVGGLHASRLRGDEVVLRGTTRLDVTRIAIDSFTQAPVDTALLREEIVIGGNGDLQLVVDLPDPPADPADIQRRDALCGFTLLALKELLLGTAPVGGTAAVGRGRVELAEHATLTVERDRLVYTVGMAQGADGDTAGVLNGWVTAFHEAGAPPGAVHG